MIKNLVIVESPAKAKIIKKYLNENDKLKKFGKFNVIASFGHIRDLDSKNGIDTKNNFKPNYVLIKNNFNNNSGANMKNDAIKNLDTNIKNVVKNKGTIWLAADMDREGEAIAWHIKQHFNIKNSKRITFNEITKEAIENAVLNPRKIDNDLVDAQQARRFIDRIVGFSITPILWKKFNTPNSLSAGRVQSATLKIIIDKENEIQKFKTKSYYTASGNFKIDKYDIDDAKYQKNDSLHKFDNDKSAYKFLKDLKPDYSLDNIKVSNKSSKPPPPFITSSLQQTASGELKMSIKQVMGSAQILYEAGLITYMRTDSYNLSNDFLKKLEKYIVSNYTEDYLDIKQFGKKSKNSQEAHEAIRPTNINKTPSDITISGKLQSKEKKLYDIIWKRTVASQMKSAKYYEVKICIKNSNFKKNECFLGKFKIYYFEGYMIVYGEKSNSNFNIQKYQDDIKSKSSKLKMLEVNAKQTWETPPPRYSESSIVKVLEKEGIGRPSTYSSILGKLYDKRYVEKKDIVGDEKEYIHFKLVKRKIITEKIKRPIIDEKSKLVPTDTGSIINDFMIKNFSNIVDVNFTSNIEEDFDKIAEGKKKLLNVMNNFYGDFDKNINKVNQQVKSNVKKNDKVKLDSYQNKIKYNNKEYSIYVARYGPVISFKNNEQDKTNYISLVPYLKATNKSIEDIVKSDVKLLTNLPLKIGKYNNNDVVLKYARYGFYLSNGNQNASIFKQYIPLVINNDFDKIMDNIKNKNIKFK